jgi:hypothetical protein
VRSDDIFLSEDVGELLKGQHREFKALTPESPVAKVDRICDKQRRPYPRLNIPEGNKGFTVCSCITSHGDDRHKLIIPALS